MPILNVQPTYTERQRRGVPGMINEMVDYNTVTRTIESVGGVAYPVAVSQGTYERSCIVGGTLAGFVGITLRDITIVNSSSPDVYPQNTNVGVLTKGEMYALAPAGGVATGDPVYFDGTTGALLKAAGAGIIGPIVGARWKFAAAAGALAIVQLGVQR